MDARTIATALGGHAIKGGFMASCPCHDDGTESLKISDGNKGVVLFCHAGCSSLNVITELKRSGLWPEKVKAREQKFVSVDAKDKPAGAPPAGKKPKVKDADLKIIAQYPYLDAGKNELYRVIRYEPKTFKVKNPHGWGMPEGVEKVLYRLPELLDAVKTGKTIFLVEGEKDVDRLCNMGLRATTNQGGAAKWAPHYSQVFKGAKVIIIPDNDAAGEKHVTTVAPQLKTVGASVRVLNLPDLPEKGDVSDWLDAGGTKAELLKLAGAAPEWQARKTILGTEFQAESFFRKYLRGRLIQTPEAGPFVWDGLRFEASDAGAMRLAMEAITELQVEDFDLAKKLSTLHGVNAVLRLSHAYCYGSLSEFDRDPDLLNCLNGVLDLRTGEVRRHNPDYRMSRLVNVAYDPKAKAPLWEAFLKRVMDGDGEMIDYLQRAAGYSLTGHIGEQVLFFCHGSGANGKSIFIEILRALLSEYACSINKNTLMDHDRKGGGIPNDIARLAQKRYVSVSETTQSDWFDEGLVKDMTGDDVLTARFLRREFFDFLPRFKLWLRGNHKPEIKGNDPGIWRRFHLIPFTVSIPEAQRDRNLRSKLLLELPGILNWAVTGNFIWREMGLNPPLKVMSAVRDYQAEMDIIGHFIADNCDATPEGSVRVKEFYKVYSNWCEEFGHRPLSFSRLNKAMRQRDGIKEGRDNENYVIHQGIELKPAKGVGRYV
jgi:putative DNA primase/helicase